MTATLSGRTPVDAISTTMKETTPKPTASFSRTLLLTGGHGDNPGIHSLTETFPTIGACPPSSLPDKRWGHTTFMTAGDRPVIATCGGEHGVSGPLPSSCLVLDASSGQWEENRMAPMLQERALHTAVTLEEQVYVIAGFGSASSSTEILQANTTHWQQGPPLPVEMRLQSLPRASSSSTEMR